MLLLFPTTNIYSMFHLCHAHNFRQPKIIHYSSVKATRKLYCKFQWQVVWASSFGLKSLGLVALVDEFKQIYGLWAVVVSSGWIVRWALRDSRSATLDRSTCKFFELECCKFAPKSGSSIIAKRCLISANGHSNNLLDTNLPL